MDFELRFSDKEITAWNGTDETHAGSIGLGGAVEITHSGRKKIIKAMS